MHHNRNPVYANGDKNVFCPYYRNCLDDAVELKWEYWACLDCYHQKNETFSGDALHFPVDTDSYYSLPGFFLKKTANTSL